METVFETRTKIVGVTRGNRQDLLEELSEMDDIRLVREPNNPHDENAIAVLNPDGEKLGYIRSGLAKELVSYMKLYPDAVLIGEILEITGDEVGKNYGCNIEVSLVRLTNNKNRIDTRKKRKISKAKVLTIVMVFILSCTGAVFLFIGLYGTYLFDRIGDVDSTVSIASDYSPPSNSVAESRVDNSEEIAAYQQKLDFRFDEMENITWIYAKGQNRDISGFTCYTYIGKRDDGYWIRFVLGFSQDDWVFMDAIKMKCDDNVFNYVIDYSEKKTDIGNSGTIYEWFDTGLTDSQIHALRSVCAGQETKVRCYGDKYHEDFVLTDSQKANIITILDYYDLVKE